MMGGPLEGLRVIEASRVSAGSIAGVLLADHGAEVIKLEPKGGGWSAQSPARKGWDRNKRSIELDYEQVGDLEAIKQLAQTADVLILSMEDDTAGWLGLDSESLAAINPKLVVCSLTAYGADTPMAGRPYGESLAAARLGAMIEKGNPHRPDAPFYLGHPALQYGQAFLAVIDILAALRARWEAGVGQHVEASLLDSFLAQSPMNWWWHEHGLSYIARPDKPSTTGTPFGYTRLITGLFQCGDGEYLQVHSGGPGSFKRLTDLLGFGDRIQALPGVEMGVPLEEDEYRAVRVDIYPAFKQKPRAEWLELFYANDIATLPVLGPAEGLLDDQVDAMGQRVVVADDEHGEIHQAGPAIRFRGCAQGVVTPAPKVGADNAALPELISRSRAPYAHGSRAIKHALEGLRVLDLSSFFACGYAGRLLSDLGADVIKIETAGGDQMRPLPDPFEACQRGKRGIVIDLKSASGIEIFHRLVREADVVMHNWRPGKAEKAGIGYEALAKINPRLIYAYLPGYGSVGPKAKLKSFAPLISGFCGLLYEGAGEGNAPVPSVFGNEDYNNGFLAAVGVLMAINRRYLTGEGDYLECPQVHSSLFTTSEHCLDKDRQIVWGMRMGGDQMGFSALDRLYQASDGGWICIAVTDDAGLAGLAQAIGRPDLALDPRFGSAAARSANDAELAKMIATFVAGLGASEAFERFDAAGVPCEIPVERPWLRDFFHADWAEGSERVFDYPDSIHGHVREIGILTRLSATPALRRGSAPRLGEHTAEVLRELGYGQAEIKTLADRGDVMIAAPS